MQREGKAEKRRVEMSAAKEREEKRTNGRREGQENRKGVEEKRERESSYYKWQSLPGAYDKGLSSLPDIEITQ